MIASTPEALLARAERIHVVAEMLRQARDAGDVEAVATYTRLLADLIPDQRERHRQQTRERTRRWRDRLKTQRTQEAESVTCDVTVTSPSVTCDVTVTSPSVTNGGLDGEPRARVVESKALTKALSQGREDQKPEQELELELEQEQVLPPPPPPAAPVTRRSVTPRTTWLTPFDDAWRQQFGGPMRCERDCRPLKRLCAAHPEGEVLDHWCLYLASQSEGKFASGAGFESTYGEWDRGRPPTRASPNGHRMSKQEVGRMNLAAALRRRQAGEVAGTYTLEGPDHGE